MSNKDELSGGVSITQEDYEVEIVPGTTLQKDELSGGGSISQEDYEKDMTSSLEVIQGLKNVCDRLSLTVKIQRQKYGILEKKLLGMTNSIPLIELVRTISSEPQKLTHETLFSVETTLGTVKMINLLEDTFVIIEAPESLLIGKTVNFNSSVFGAPECTAVACHLLGG